MDTAKYFWARRLCITAILAAALSRLPTLPARAAGTVSLTTLGSAYTQDFNTLASSGTTNTTVPTGWDFSEIGTSANTTYRAGTGSDNTGDTYSFGATGSAARAFGGLRSGSLVPLISVQFTNNTSEITTSLEVAYTGEQWRLGQNTTGRAADRLDFQLSTDATSLTTGTWSDYDNLDFSSPVVSGTVGAIVGNVSPNRTTLNFPITGLSIVSGTTFWIRWADTDLISGADEELSIDDFSLTPSATDPLPSISSTVPANGATNVPVNTNLTVTFGEPVTVTDPWFTLTCTVSGTHATTVSGGPTTFTLTPETDFTSGESCTLTILAANVKDQDTNDPPDNMVANFSVGFSPFDACAQSFTPIYQIQGSGLTAAITGLVTTKGVVVGDYEYPGSGSSSNFLRGFYLRSHPSLAQAFSVNATGAVFIVDVNHLKSKGSACDDPDAGDGQGNCNVVRTNAVEELLAWLATDPTGTGDPDTLLIGDYNSYAQEDPITTITSAGFTNLIEQFLGSDAYSYVFDGQWGYLDHALASASLVSQVTGVGDSHINADELSVLDYNDDFKSAGQIVSLYAPDQFRVSDHDPVVIGLAPTAPPRVRASFSAASSSCGANNATLNVTITDADTTDTHTTLITWSDSSSQTLTAAARSFPVPHTYASPGQYTATVKVTDSYGHIATTTATVTINFTSSGIRQPINADGSSVFKFGRTVPVKVKFIDCNGVSPATLAPLIKLVVLSEATPGQEINEPESTAAADITGILRFSDGQYIYNLATRVLPDPRATYQIVITVPATRQTVTSTFGLK